jgi:dihydroorotase
MKIIVRNGQLVTPTGVVAGDLFIDDGVIVEVGPSLSVVGATEIDASGALVGPSFVDLHTHLREPGGEAAETVASGTRAAAAGGYGAVVAMPNTEPCLDTPALVSHVYDLGAKTPLDVAVAGAITQGRLGESLSPMAEMAALGVRLFTDDGTGVQSAAVMRRALTYAKALDVTLAQHCEDITLAGGVMNEGPLAAQLGLAGRSVLAEEIMVARDIALVRATGCPVHFLHLSSAQSLALVAAAKAEGLPITCEVAPHHFTLDESEVSAYDAVFKVNPPLRHRDDMVAIRDALVTSTIDAVATDHAPHAPEMKDQSFDEAPAGMLGLEHAASLTWAALGSSITQATRFFDLLSRAPARIARLRQMDVRPRHTAHGGSLIPGEDANLVIFDPSQTWTADVGTLHSRAHNTPYVGRTMNGRVRATIVRGRVVATEGAATW